MNIDLGRYSARYSAIVLVIICVLGLLPQPSPAAQQLAGSLSYQPSLFFIENVGQFAPGARFQGWGGTGALWLAQDALWLTLVEDSSFMPSIQPDAQLEAEPRRAVNLKLSFIGANPHPGIEPSHRLETRLSYFTGNDPASWRADVPVWGSVRYTNLYPGVDLVVGAAPGQSHPWQLEAHDGANLSNVQLRVEGAEELAIENNHLRLLTAAGQFTLPLLSIESAAQPQTSVRHVGEQVFDISSPFVAAPPADPAKLERQTGQADASFILAYATYLGGSFYERGRDMAVDSAGNVYLVGSTQSPDFPTTPGVPGEFYYGGDYDAFVAKLNNSGSALEFATFLGGVGDDWGNDYGYGVAADAGGKVYVTGWTDSRAFPVTSGAYDTTYNGGYYDSFAAKLNATGAALLYATYLGGVDQEKGGDIEADSAGNAYLTGWTASPDFPSVAADSNFDTFQGGESDVFVAKLNSAGSALEYALFVGGSDLEIGTRLAVDAGGYAYLTGWTESSDFPWRLAIDATLDGDTDAFVACVRSSGSNLFYSTYLGGSNDEIGWSIALDGARNAYIVGATNSTDFPVTAGAFDNSFNGGNVDAFVAKLSASTLHYATYLGGAGDEQGYGIAVDGAGNAYVTGDLGKDVITRLDPTGSTVDYRFTLDSFENNVGDGIAVDAQGAAYVLAYASYQTLPTTPGAFDATPNHIWLAKAAAPALITGQVTDGNGLPLSGIHIAAGSLYSATTNASGQYTLTVPGGKHTFAPTAPGYFWSPASRSAAVPPAATGQDFAGKSIAKEVTPGGNRAVDYGSALTYTVRLVAPQDKTVLLYDPVPSYTTFISGSVSAPPGVGYDAASNAISGTITLTLNLPLTVTFQARVEVTGTADWAPRIVNRACAHPPGSGLSACEWSDETINYTYVWPIYLPLVMR